jgi:hypothetical protein
MFTTAGAARATESAKLCMTMGALDAAAPAWPVLKALGAAVREALVAAFCAAIGVAPAGGAAAVCAPNSVGFHQTTRNATARPITTALIKKFTRTRVFCK